MMLEVKLNKLSDRVYCITAPTNIGVYVIKGNEVMLIDSGSTKTFAKRIERILNENNLTPKMLVNTHSHSDHIGGNEYLQSAFNIPVYAYKADEALVEYPRLSPSLTWGGGINNEISGKFWIAAQCNSKPLTPEILPDGVEIIELFGHTGTMIGFKADNVIFLGDSVVGEQVISSSGIPYNFNIGDQIKTLEKVKTLSADFFVPSHSEIKKDIIPLAELNRKTIFGIVDSIRDICQTPHTCDEIIEKMFEKYSVKCDLTQYTLVGSTIRSYISYMLDEGMIEWITVGSKLMWQNR